MCIRDRSGRIGYTGMNRRGYMRNGMAPNNSQGKSGTANFLDGGVKGRYAYQDTTMHVNGGNCLMLLLLFGIVGAIFYTCLLYTSRCVSETDTKISEISDMAKS